MRTKLGGWKLNLITATYPALLSHRTCGFQFCVGEVVKQKEYSFMYVVLQHINTLIRIFGRNRFGNVSIIIAYHANTNGYIKYFSAKNKIWSKHDSFFIYISKTTYSSVLEVHEKGIAQKDLYLSLCKKKITQVKIVVKQNRCCFTQMYVAVFRNSTNIKYSPKTLQKLGKWNRYNNNKVICSETDVRGDKMSNI